MQRFYRKFLNCIILPMVLSAAIIVSVAPTAFGQNANETTACGRLKSVDLGSDTMIILTREFRVGDPIALDEAQKPLVPKAQKDLCLVKLVIGPGKPGPADAPSTSTGIGLNVWLPAVANWNKRYMAYGQGGYAGSPDFKSVTALNVRVLAAVAAAQSGYVTSNSDDGHTYGNSRDGSFALDENGQFNWPLLKDWAYRGLHLTAVTTKALIKAYYGEAPTYSYWNGQSTGGREGLMIAQRYPKDFNGIVSAYPAINWPRFLPGIMWAQIVMQQDLGGPIAEPKLANVTTAAISSCDRDLTGQHDGYINNAFACRYDPTKDLHLLCKSSGGEGSGDACLSLAEAKAVNKIWYGPRIDGDMQDPAVDVGLEPELQAGQLWYGYNRGALLHNSPISSNIGPAGLNPFTIGSDWIAITLRDRRFATNSFVNAGKTGEDLWKSIGYAGKNSFLNYFLKSTEHFGGFNATNNPDLEEFRQAGGKIIHWHGLSDNQIPAAGSLHYYLQVKALMGEKSAGEFYRFYLVPGMGHGKVGGPALTPVPGGDGNDAVKLGNALVEIVQRWVEAGSAPEAIPVASDENVPPVRHRLWCPYPQQLKYIGGDVNVATSFSCDSRAQ